MLSSISRCGCRHTADGLSLVDPLQILLRTTDPSSHEPRNNQGLPSSGRSGVHVVAHNGLRKESGYQRVTVPGLAAHPVVSALVFLPMIAIQHIYRKQERVLTRSDSKGLFHKSQCPKSVWIMKSSPDKRSHRRKIFFYKLKSDNEKGTCTTHRFYSLSLQGNDWFGTACTAHHPCCLISHLNTIRKIHDAIPRYESPQCSMAGHRILTIQPYANEVHSTLAYQQTREVQLHTPLWRDFYSIRYVPLLSIAYLPLRILSAETL